MMEDELVAAVRHELVKKADARGLLADVALPLDSGGTRRRGQDYYKQREVRRPLVRAQNPCPSIP